MESTTAAKVRQGTGAPIRHPKMRRDLRKLVIPSPEFAKFFFLPHEKVLQAWDRVFLEKDRDFWRRNYIPGAEWFRLRGGLFHHREVNLTKEMAVEVCRRLNGKRVRAVQGYYDAPDPAFVDDWDKARGWDSANDWTPLEVAA
ncbi:hypothetical protein [Bordetella bronchialis]|uniref:Uncharacterized protein n=1 Tax=Bordetella bronchialis TaxID=463025 RepID=A0A193FWJ8_9BORD|nr:hypothetical protein [Bordetella bronchialis]ANN71556.1 hypothetical protein BAU08_09580 [Bordetella bronchialis]